MSSQEQTKFLPRQGQIVGHKYNVANALGVGTRYASGAKSIPKYAILLTGCLKNQTAC